MMHMLMLMHVVKCADVFVGADNDADTDAGWSVSHINLHNVYIMCIWQKATHV